MTLEQDVTILGVMRKLDLDQLLFVVRDPVVGEVECRFEHGLTPQVLALIGHPVTVRGQFQQHPDQPLRGMALSITPATPTPRAGQAA